MGWRRSFSLTVFFAGIASGSVLANEVEGIRVWPAPDETRVVLDMEEEPTFTYFTLTKPDRLVIDLKETSLKSSLPVVVKDSDVLTKIRSSSPPETGTSRLVFETRSTTSPKIFKLPPTPDGHYSHRLVLDLPHAAKAETVKSAAAGSKATAVDSIHLPYGNDDIIVAIDAGHGGEDPGSIGPSRKYEKNVTLTIARKVADRINATPGMKAVMTRRGDYFVNLNKRSEIARKNKAHLLVSIHADGFHKPQPQGASVWVLNTRRANTEIGRWLEQHEKQSELLGGGDVLSGGQDDQYLSMAVLDLQFSHSQKEGYDVASRVLNEMAKVTKLHKSKPEHASLAVLKSPDIPSLLVETGFITNPREERLLNSTSHQNKLSEAVYKGVLAYFNDKPPEGTLFAARKHGIKHKVASGESLSVIADKYSSSVQGIRQMNQLSSNVVKVGQILRIPAGKTTSHSSGTNSSAAVASITQSIVVHTVQRGEFLGKIASQYKVTLDSIRQASALRSDELAVGQKLNIPVQRKLVEHTVRRGEFLGKIAARYGVSVSSIRQANQLSSDTLAVGQKLKIPST